MDTLYYWDTASGTNLFLNRISTLYTIKIQKTQYRFVILHRLCYNEPTYRTMLQLWALRLLFIPWRWRLNFTPNFGYSSTRIDQAFRKRYYIALGPILLFLCCYKLYYSNLKPLFMASEYNVGNTLYYSDATQTYTLRLLIMVIGIRFAWDSPFEKCNNTLDM